MAVITEGHPFPTNLDGSRPNLGVMKPGSEQNTVLQGLKEASALDLVIQMVDQVRADAA